MDKGFHSVSADWLAAHLSPGFRYAVNRFF